MDIGQRIQFLRKRRKYSVLQLSISSQLSRSYIYELESGNKSPSIETIEQICAALQISLSTFFDEETMVPALEVPEDPILTMYYRLSPSNQKSIRVLMESMLE